MDKLMRDLEKQGKQFAKDDALKSTYEINCEHCKKMIKVKVGTSKCPYCNKDVKLELKF
ncbi:MULTISPECIES: hypothetical protein [Carnobacterium]|jgi:Zn finger protein HypA/HybF involved in hydrogenase expression|uniref:hypothetical protein n=1 Tax=Carnobacterium TaxID=2747 RepID=UPI0007148341|nr:MULTISPECIES: hypothetical protein [Carnobacterium]KRN60370.1 hypothetical protein IV70_GL001096 [Carnobacterium maltaromaticum DSM 20342]